MASSLDAVTVQRRLDQLRWYHTIDVVPGATTRGWFDQRHAVPLMPWPDVRGKRCLDIGTWDGFYAFELERRGAAEVFAVDVPDLAEIDYPPEVRAQSDFNPSQSGTQERSAGFHLIHEIIDSSVRWVPANVYNLDPSEIGTFDVVVCGSVLLHLRDPVRALDAIRRVTSGSFLSIEFIDAAVNAIARRRPLFELRGESADFQWWLASDAGLRRMLHVAGFAIDRVSKPFLLRPGPGGRDIVPKRGARATVDRTVKWAATKDSTRGGHMHRAYLTHPRF